MGYRTWPPRLEGGAPEASVAGIVTGLRHAETYGEQATLPAVRVGDRRPRRRRLRGLWTASGKPRPCWS